ncbi:free fatty acid receptor 1 [Neofelis nebulosa]|uniref:free fatty acid receptor 1 n=1 Tax=Neofelis nebulosa TaxID=61452 RepID=UPI00272B0F16|nr:free fatty acid receptor 1 [Neofelis nebulosa]
MDLPPQLSFALYVAAFALGFPLNALAIGGAVSHARLRLTPSLVYALHLGCSDLLLAASLPLKAVEALALGAWPLPASLCPAFALAHFAPLYAGGGFLAALSVGRYLGAAFPLGYQAARRPRYSWGVCVAIWALVLCHLGLVFGLEAPGGWTDNTNSSLGINTPVNGSPVCLEAWDPASAGPARLSLSLLLFFLPLTITAFCYVGCLRALARSGLSHRRKLRAAWVAGGALLTLLLCLGPYNASNVAAFLHPDTGGRWRKLGLITGAWSVVLNPLVTGYLGGGAGRATSVARTKGGTSQKQQPPLERRGMEQGRPAALAGP